MNDDDLLTSIGILWVLSTALVTVGLVASKLASILTLVVALGSIPLVPSTSGCATWPDCTTPLTAGNPSSLEPWLLTMLPPLSILNWPAREYWVALLRSLSWKNPPPPIAMSSGLSLVVMLPWENCCDTAARLTPRPMPLAPPPPPPEARA